MAYGKYNVVDVGAFCVKMLGDGGKIEEQRKKDFQFHVDNLIESKKESKGKWWGFLVKVPTQEEAEEYLNHNGGFFSSYDFCMSHYHEDERRLIKLMHLCKTCPDDVILLSAKEAKVLSSWGFPIDESRIGMIKDKLEALNDDKNEAAEA